MNKYQGQTNFSFKPEKGVETISISTVLSMLQEPFNQHAVAEKTYAKHHDNPESEYYNMSVDEIIDKWTERGQESLRYGKLNDSYIGIVLEGTEEDKELFVLDNDADNDLRLKVQMDSFDQFIDDLPENIVLVAREKTVYYRINEIYIKGRFDALLYDTEKKIFIVVDWKTSGQVDTKPTKWTGKLLGPAKCFDALNWYTYTLQTFFYKLALVENNYLPEGTDFSKITVRIVNFPGKEFENGKLYKSYREAFEFNKEQLDSIFNFAYRKNKLINKK